jgi:hypothetical protein
MMSSESLLALEPCGQSGLWNRGPELGPALAKDSYVTAGGSPESGVPDRDPSGHHRTRPPRIRQVRVETGGDALTPRSAHPRRGLQAAAGSSPPR